MRVEFTSLLPFAAVIHASAVPKDHAFRGPGPFDSRSPCPGLNALANHGFLPHDGKNLDYEMINTAAKEAYNFADGVFVQAVDMVFQFNISTTDRPTETFHLVDLARHDTIEVDGSLTRNDIYFGDDNHFDATVFAAVARDLGLDQSHRGEDKFVTVETAATATKNRKELAQSVNPTFNNSEIRHLLEYGTTGLYLLTVWDEDRKAAPKSWVQALLGEDRIAYEAGYSKGQSVKTEDQLTDLTNAVREAAGYKA